MRKRRPLSPRELEVAVLVADDLTDKEIANILRISIRTVQEHLDRIGEKLRLGRSKKTRRRAIRAWVVSLGRRRALRRVKEAAD